MYPDSERGAGFQVAALSAPAAALPGPLVSVSKHCWLNTVGSLLPGQLRTSNVADGVWQYPLTSSQRNSEQVRSRGGAPGVVRSPWRSRRAGRLPLPTCCGPTLGREAAAACRVSPAARGTLQCASAGRLNVNTSVYQARLPKLCIMQCCAWRSTSTQLCTCILGAELC